MRTRPSRKRITIILRGVTFQVTPELARELEAQERETLRKEWSTNQLID